MTDLDCLVIADDLTGACDAAVHFARRGLATSVMLAMDPPPAGTRVVAVSTDSRHLGENTAAELVATVADWLKARVIFKKIDSVLRGNPGAEIAAAMQAFHCDAVVATPAFPAMGRIVDSTNRTEVQHRLRADVHVSPSEVAAALKTGTRVISVDAESEADLDTIVSAAGMSQDRRILWAGAGGLAAALAKQWGRPPGPPGQRSAAKLIFCIGSDHPVTLTQLQHLLQARPHSQILPLGPLPDCEALLLSGGDTASAVCREAGARRIDLIDEILPGIPWGILRCGRFDGLPVVTKSGGFGAPDALLRVAEFLRMSNLPTIALTIGDPAGVGPEITVKALADPELAPLANWVVVGDSAVFEMLGTRPDCLLDARALDGEIEIGQLDPRCGAAGVEYVRIATGTCLRGEADAMVTAPLNKEAVTLSGRAFSGHTEYIAELCGATESRMLLASERLCTVHVTTHVALRAACALSTERIVRTIELGHEAMQLLGFDRPRIAVCGLNPHAGEHGLFGEEDARFIVPAVAAARAEGLDCSGPHAGDTVFLQASRGAYDLVVAMYHDQGHIPMKLLDFEGTVNISLGIPIIRTSVDHGTAFDIAGRNLADPRSMKQAMRMAARMATTRRRAAK